MGVKIHESAVGLIKTGGSDIKLVTAPPVSQMMGGPNPEPKSEEEKRLMSEAEMHKLNQKIPNHNKIITSLVVGGLAGAVAKTTIAPLDRTKINFQISSDKKYSFRGAVRFLAKTLKHEGVLALWRGNTATMARIIPYSAIQFSSHEQWKSMLSQNNERHLPPLRRYMAGSLAGVTASTLTYPLDMARARMAVTKKCMYSSLVEVFLKIYREEGMRTLYRGYTPTLLGVIPYAGTSFFTYETLKKAHSDRTQDHRGPSAVQRLCFGAIAGLLGQSTSYPLDICRRRMQTAGLLGKEHVYRNVVSTIVHVAKTEGIKGGLYKGLSMNWIKGPVAVGISFTTFDICQRHLRKFEFFQYNDDDT